MLDESTHEERECGECGCFLVPGIGCTDCLAAKGRRPDPMSPTAAKCPECREVMSVAEWEAASQVGSESCETCDDSRGRVEEFLRTGTAP